MLKIRTIDGSGNNRATRIVQQYGRRHDPYHARPISHPARPTHRSMDRIPAKSAMSCGLGRRPKHTSRRDCPQSCMYGASSSTTTSITHVQTNQRDQHHDPPGDPRPSPGGTIALNRFIPIPTTGTAINSVTGWLDGRWYMVPTPPRLPVYGCPTGTWRPVPTATCRLSMAHSSAATSAPTENPDLTAITTLFVREHNYWVDQLQAQHPDWTGDQLYQQARAIVTAEIRTSHTPSSCRICWDRTPSRPTRL